MKPHGPIRCPSCQGPLVPAQLHCEPCDLTVSGHFAQNEFATLGQDDLHFLRIFVITEGRIRDMEAALGVSYPTIKSRLSQLKLTLAAATNPEVRKIAEAAEAAEPANASTAAVLKDLQAGRISFEEAMARIKHTQKGENP